MIILVLGGTRFIGPVVVRRLVASGHTVTVFHRGHTEADLPAEVGHVHGERSRVDLQRTVSDLLPDVVLDLMALTERDAQIGVAAIEGVAGRVVVVSSQDVYRVYDRLLGRDPSPPDPAPMTETAPLRRNLYPYRAMAPDEDHHFFRYDKILVERAYRASSVPATVLRLPAVYGPGDYQHRLFPYLKRMDDDRPFIPLDAGQAAWRWTRGYVEDIAAAVALAIEHDRAAGEVYNVGEMTALTEAAWIRRLGDAVGWTGRVVALPPPPGTTGVGHDWRHQFVADTRKIREELGYRESVSVDEALRRTIAWERAHPPPKIDPEAFDYPAEDAWLAAAQGSGEQ